MARGLLYIFDDLGTPIPVVGTLDSLPDVDSAGLLDGYTLVWDNANQKWIVAAGTPSPVTIRDTTVPQGDASTMDFTGDGVQATVSGGVATINIPGATGSAIGLEDLTDVDLTSPAIDQSLVYDTGVSQWVNKGVQRSIMFSYQGNLVVGLNELRFYNVLAKDLTIEKVHLAVSSAPTDAAIIVDVHKNGTTIFTTQANRPQIAASAFTGQSTVIQVPTWAVGEYLQVAIDQIGSSIAGANLCIQIVVR